MIYVAAPYSHSDPLVREARYKEVTKYAAHLMGKGHYIYSPITHCHPMQLVGNLPTTWEFWSNMCIAFMPICTQIRILDLPGYEVSVGVYAECLAFERAGKEVFHVHPLTYELTEFANTPS